MTPPTKPRTRPGQPSTRNGGTLCMSREQKGLGAANLGAHDRAPLIAHPPTALDSTHRWTTTPIGNHRTSAVARRGSAAKTLNPLVSQHGSKMNLSLCLL